MSETTQAPKPSATHPPTKPKVEPGARHSSAFTATVDSTGPAPGEFLIAATADTPVMTLQVLEAVRIELSKDERLLNEKSFLWSGANV